MKVCVQKGRKQIIVLNWGEAPFAREETKYGVAYIPHNFVAEACSQKHVWLASTRVIDGAAEYRFSSKQNPEIKSSWKRNPTAAYGEANMCLKNPHFRTGTNAAVIIGCSYPNVQEKILERFEFDIARQFSKPSLKRKVEPKAPVESFLREVEQQPQISEGFGKRSNVGTVVSDATDMQSGSFKRMRLDTVASMEASEAQSSQPQPTPEISEEFCKPRYEYDAEEEISEELFGGASAKAAEIFTPEATTSLDTTMSFDDDTLLDDQLLLFDDI